MRGKGGSSFTSCVTSPHSEGFVLSALLSEQIAFLVAKVVLTVQGSGKDDWVGGDCGGLARAEEGMDKD